MNVEKDPRRLVCESCAVDEYDDDTVQLRAGGKVLCEDCVEEAEDTDDQ